MLTDGVNPLHLRKMSRQEVLQMSISNISFSRYKVMQVYQSLGGTQYNCCSKEYISSNHSVY
jgi:hypothetical protein